MENQTTDTLTPTAPNAVVDGMAPETRAAEAPQYNQAASLDVQTTPVKKKNRFSATSKILGVVLGLGATVLTLRSRTANSRVKAAKELDVVSATGDTSIERMNSLFSSAGSILEADTLNGLMDKAKASVGKLAGKRAWNSEIENLNQFAGKKSGIKGELKKAGDYLDPLGKEKNNGVFPLIMRTLGLGIYGGAKVGGTALKATGEAARISLIEGTSGKRAKRIDGQINKKLEGVEKKFSDGVYKEIAKTENVKVGLGDHAKNGLIALGVGAVVMGATMAVSKFIEKRREAKRAEKYAGQLELQREIAMIAPETQMAVAPR